MAPKLRLMQVAAGQWNPWANLIKDKDGTIYVEGLMGDVLRTLAKVIKFDYEVVESPDGYWGTPIGNGSWNGMIGMVHREEVEFALGPFSLTTERAAVVDFTSIVSTDNNAILAPRPTIKNDIQGFLKAFTLEVWLLILWSLVIVSLSMIFIQKIEGILYNRTEDVTSKSVMWSIKAFTQEGSEWLPENNGGRLLVTTWLFASLIIMSSYSGILTAMMTLPLTNIPIDSLEDLVSQTEIPYRYESQIVYEYLKASKDPVHQMAYQGMSGSVYSCWDVKENIANEEYAIICPKSSVMQIISWDFSTTGGCRMYMAREYVLDMYMQSLAFKKHSSYLEKANNVLHRLTESGLITHWLNDNYKNMTQCMRPLTADRSATDVTALNIEAFGGSFILLIGGFLLALLTFLGEEAVFHHNREMENE